MSELAERHGRTTRLELDDPPLREWEAIRVQNLPREPAFTIPDNVRTATDLLRLVS